MTSEKEEVLKKKQHKAFKIFKSYKFSKSVQLLQK